MAKFVHLHNHTHYSLLDGLTKIDELVGAAKKDDAPAVAITDHGTMYGVIEFYEKCKKAGIKPIVGVEAYLAPGSRTDKATKEDERNYHLLLLAKNNAGYKNLLKLTSIAHLEGYYYKPRIDWEVLSLYKDGLIACTACASGEIPKLIIAGNLPKARKRILEYKELFGPGNFYLELQDHPSLPEQKIVNRELIEFSRELGVPLVATNDLHYLKEEDADVQDVLLCLQTKRKKEDSNRMEMSGSDYYYKTAREMEKFFSDVPEALSNTLKIAEECNVEIEMGNVQLPYFKVPEGQNEMGYIRKLCEEGLEKRRQIKFSQAEPAIKERLDYELSVIEKMGWPSYFLIVADFVNWAKDNGIVVGPGRGSAAGSLACYLMGITNLDPLKYDLLFERFLNPDRISMPDIDMDFADLRRDEVIRYVEKKYGKEHVSQIITFGTMAARASLRDVGRVLDYPYEYCDRLAKMIPPLTKLKKAIGLVPELKEIYEKEDAAKKILTYAMRLEGVARHASTHACGVLITKNPLTDYVPLQYASSSDRSIVSQYSLHPIEDLGLLKMDFLGLKNLTIIESAIRIIKNTRGLKIDIDKIPLDDPDTFGLFQNGETTGVFQFESSGMKRYMKELKPNDFEDIVAMVALYRPGPMEWIPDYIQRKYGRKKVEYLHPKLEPILKKTYGVAIYQEQVMQIARQLAGFSMGEADVLRKAMGKKIAELLAEQKEKFIDGCVKNGISKELGEGIFSFIEPFAGYGFNRSHAACYALIGYQTAYLKAHWPTEFMAALLISDQGDIDRVAIEIEECRKMGIEVLAPDINQSFDFFTVITSGTQTNQIAREDEKVNTIRFGLKAIKNFGAHIGEAIIKERKENGPFKNISDLLKRVVDKDLNKKSLESLIKSGSLDQFGERGMFLENIEAMLSFNKDIARAKSSAQVSLFFDAPLLNQFEEVKLKPAAPVERQKKLAWEKEFLGLYISDHPFLDFKKEAGALIPPIREVKRASRNEPVNLAGIIASVKKIITKNGESMAFVKIEDDTDNLEALVFPRLYKSSGEIWQEGKAVALLGKLSEKDQDVKLLCDKAVILELGKVKEILRGLKPEYRTNGNSFTFNGRNTNGNGQEGGRGDFSAKNEGGVKKTPRQEKIVLISIGGNFDNNFLETLKKIFLSAPGSSKVFLKVKNEGQKDKIVETGFKVSAEALASGQIQGVEKLNLELVDKV
ncbi:MAG: DNA polymerase III subunit alpha [Patescibacteria group bacterium]|jgi:DNA polymerase-3 subunit alpha